jgi:hypothetical protein
MAHRAGTLRRGALQRQVPKRPHKPASQQLGARGPDWCGIHPNDPRHPFWRRAVSAETLYSGPDGRIFAVRWSSTATDALDAYVASLPPAPPTTLSFSPLPTLPPIREDRIAAALRGLTPEEDDDGPT